MRIELTSIYVDEQDKALRFYSEVLGFVKKADVSEGGYRWLTVASREAPDGTRLQYERLQGLGVRFTVPLTKQGWGSMAVLDDTCGNLIQLTQPLAG